MDEEKNLKPEIEEDNKPQEPVSEQQDQTPEVSMAETPEAENEIIEEQPAEGEQIQPTEEITEEEAAAVEEPVSPPVEPTVVYRWDYGAQRQYDEDLRRKKERKKSGLAFFGIISCAFLVVIGLLIGVLAFRDYFTPRRQVLDTTQSAEELLPSTVLITATQGTSGATGSGFFVRDDGMIATNYHVVEGADTIKVKLYGSTEKKEATLVGYNAECDIAVLKIPGTGYPAVTFGNSSAMRVGDVAVAIGNPAGTDAQWTLTKGIISSTDRRLLLTDKATEIVELKMIQTDAAVNPGNSGGLLCNDNGEVIGIIARKQVYRVLISGSNETITLFDEGIGYAIPGNGAKQIIEGIINIKDVDPASVGLLRRRPKIGITVISVKRGEKLIDEQENNAPQDGILVSTVNNNGANGLLSPGDIIIQFDGVSVTDSDQLIEMLYSYKRGDKVKVRVIKNGEFFSTEIELTLGVFEE